MWLLNAMIIAIAMYSKIPMPRVDWNEKNMRYAMCFFPLVGVIIGVWEIVAGNLITVWKGEGTFLYAVVLTLIPVFITGEFIWMDSQIQWTQKVLMETERRSWRY